MKTKVSSASKRRIVTADILENDSNAPAPLNLPHGKLFFGFKHVPYNHPSDQTSNGTSDAPASGPGAFQGGGNTLSGRRSSSSPSANAKGKGKEKETQIEKDDGGKWAGKGQTLNSGSRRMGVDGPVGAGGARVPRPSSRRLPQREPSPAPDWGVDSDDEVIYDSD